MPYLALNTFTVLANASLGVWILIKNRRSDTHKIFFLLTAVFSTWTIFNYFSIVSTNPKITLNLIRAILFIASFKPPLLFLLFHTFPKEKLKIKRTLFFVVVALSLLASLLAISPFVFTRVEFVNGSPQPFPGPGMPVWAIIFFLILGSSFILLYRRMSQSVGVLRTQMKFMLLGFVLSFTFFLFTNFIMVTLFKNSSLVGFGPLFTVILAGFMAYAIVKHKLFDIKVISTEVITLSLWIILFSRFVVSSNLAELLANLLILLIVLVFGIILIRSARREVRQREQLEVLNKRLKDIDEQKDEFISMAAHELRAPMTAIKGYLSMVMEGDAGDIPEKARGYLADANAINERLVRLVNNMLNVSRIEEGRIVYQVEEENLSNVARTVHASFRSEAERKGLKFELDIPSEIRDRVKVDPDRIHEVLGNLVSNAIKYTDDGSVVIQLSQPDKKTVRVDVKDTGPGISKEEQGKLFEKFYRAETSVGKTTGTGLGLYISKLLVEEFGGKIGLDSELGEGSDFWFELPLVEKNSSSGHAHGHVDKEDKSEEKEE